MHTSDFGGGADVKGVSDYLPSDKLAPSWDSVIACLPQSARRISASTSGDVLSIFGKGALDCNPGKAQAYLLTDVGGVAYAEDEAARVIIDVAFPDFIPIAGTSSGTWQLPAPLYMRSSQLSC